MSFWGNYKEKYKATPMTESTVQDGKVFEQFQDSEHFNRGKIFVLVAHYSQAFIFATILGILNYRSGLTLAGTIQIFFGLSVAVILMIYFITRSQQFINVISFIYSIVFNTLQLITGGNNGFSLFWILVGVPCLFYFLDLGWAIAVNYGRLLIVMMFMWIPALSQRIYPYSDIIRYRYPLALALLIAYCHFIQVQYRKSRKEQNESLQLAIAYGKQAAAAQERAENAQKEAVYANRAKSQFLSNMSHDIRTPMNAINGYTHIAMTHLDDRAVVEDSLGKITIANDHLQGLINDVLDMSRIESGRENLRLSEAKVSDMVYGILPMIQTQIDNKHLNLHVDTVNLKHENVYADIQKIRQIFVNVLGNAVKFTGEGGNIDICIQELPGQEEGYASYSFHIKDNGIGMSEEFQKHIFEAFTQEYTNEESGLAGTGLGMSITKNLIDMMGGTIRVNSETGKGSEFIIQLDLKIQESVKDVVTEREEQTASIVLDGKRVLLAEDNKMNREIATMQLQEWDWK